MKKEEAAKKAPKKAEKPAEARPQPAGALEKTPAPPQTEALAFTPLEHGSRLSTVYRGVGRTIKDTYVSVAQQHLYYAGIDADVDVWLGSRLLVAILFGIVGFLLPWSLFVYLGWIDVTILSITLVDMVFIYFLSVVFATCFFFFTLFLYYMHLYYMIDDRTKRVEQSLPDFLLMVAANMRSGMTPFSAFHVSARPEFGPLEEIIKLVTAKTMGTQSLVIAFQEMTKRVDSEILDRMVDFFVKGMKSGGRLANLLETSATEIREAQELRKELVTATRTYTIFLFFIVIVGIPLLLAISSQFIGTFASIQAEQRTSTFTGGSGIEFFSGELTLEPEFLFQASILLLIITSLLISVLAGVISEGKLLYGVKYVIPISFASLVIFFLIRSVIHGMLSALGAPG